MSLWAVRVMIDRRQTQRHLTICVSLIALCVGASCLPRSSPDPNPIEGAADGVGGQDPDDIEPVELGPEANAALKDADALFDEQRYQEAARAYDAVGARHASAQGQAALMAAAARCRLGKVDEALQTLEALGRDEALEKAVRRGALGYHARCAAPAGRLDESLTLIGESYPGQAPSPYWRAEDRAPSMMALAEARRRSGDVAAALTAFSWAYELSEQGQRALIRSLALDTARELHAQDTLIALTQRDDDFVRTISGAAHLLETLSAPSLGGHSPDTLAELYASVSPALVRLNEGVLAEELARRVAALSGPSPVRIGALLPLSGRNRRAGALALGGLLLAQGSLEPGIARSTLLLRDTADSADRVRVAMNEMIDAGAVAIIGPLDNSTSSAITVAAAEVAQERQVPLIILSPNRDLSGRGDWVFRLFLDGLQEVRALIARAKAAGVTRLGVLYPKRAPLSAALAEFAAQEAQAEGLKLVHSEDYDPDHADFSNHARRMRRSRAQAVFIPDVASRVSLVMPFLASEQLWCSAADSLEGDEGERRPVLCMGNSTWADPRLLRDGDSYFKGAIIATSYAVQAPGEANALFVEAHQRRLGQAPNLIAAFAYDAGRLTRELVISRGHRDPTSMRQALLALKGFPGLNGPLSADGAGRLSSTPVVLTVERGDFVLAPPVTP